MLRRLHNSPVTSHPDLLRGIGSSDDAGVFRISDEVALVQTVDFFTPIVDDARQWGRIAAANALSDVYAMGGTPLTALSIVAWPVDTLPLDMLGDVLEGGAEKLIEAGATLLGGHSIDDPEPKYGLAVTGAVHPSHMITNGAGRPGDRLVLTKPLGTGVVTTAIKSGNAPAELAAVVVDAMTVLNRGAAAAIRRVGVVAATDVTGFGLLGHLGELARASKVSAEISVAAVPVFAGVRQLVDSGQVPSGTRRNLASAERFSLFGDTSSTDKAILADAQTNGGLLAAVEAPLVGALLQALEDEGVEGTEIGLLRERSFEDGPSSAVHVVP